MDVKVTLEKLEGPNWPRWKRQIELLLKHHEVYETTIGEVKCPTEDEAEIKKWKKADALAQVILVSNMNDSNVDITATCKSAYEIWSQLLSVYEQSSGQRLDRLLETFFSAGKLDTEDIATYVSRLKRLFTEINDELEKLSKVKLPELLLMSRVMSTLPSEYFEFKNVWESIPICDRTVSLLLERLRLIEMRLPTHSNGENASALEALSKTKLKNSKHMKKIKCFSCNQIGHFASKCPKKRSVAAKIDSNLLCFIAKNGFQDTSWIADSGASHHMTFCKDWFESFEDFPKPIEVTVGNNANIKAFGEGTIRVEITIGHRKRIRTIEKVWYVPELGKNLLSVGQTVNKGFTFKAIGDKCVFLQSGKPILFGRRRNGLYELALDVITPHGKGKAHVSTKSLTLQQWHERLAHQDKRHVKQVLQSRDIHVQDDNSFCTGCPLGKQHRKSYKSRDVRGKVPGEIILADLCGPMEVNSLGRSKYCLVMKDDYSRFRRVFFLKEKTEVPACIEMFLAEAKTAGIVVKTFMSDGGSEFVNRKVTDILNKYGITRRTVMPYTPEQTGGIEREMRTLVESARTMIHAKNLPKSLWAEAMNTACHIINRTGPTVVAGKSPIELWLNTPPSPINHFRAFGEKCYVHIPKQKRRKWSAKAEEGILVGYCGERDGYRVYNGKTVLTSADVIFVKDKINKQAEVKAESVSWTLKSPHESDLEGENQDEEVDSPEAHNEGENDDPDLHNGGNPEDDDSEIVSNANENQLITTRSGRVINAPEYLKHYVCSVSNKHDWSQAMEEEMQSLQENDVFEVVDRPVGKKIIGTKWVLKEKIRSDGTLERLKARLVARGFSQKEGDYDETFSPVARLETVRTLLSVAANEKLQLRQFDVKTAFLYGNLKEEVYVNQPHGFEDGTDRVWKLKKSLYGLKQSPRCWNERLDVFIKGQGLLQSKSDPCLYIRKKNGHKLIIVSYVDDGLIAGTDLNEVMDFLLKLESEFKIKISTPDCYLGIKIDQQENGSIVLSQRGYVEKLLTKFGMADANPVKTPTEMGGISDEGKPLDKKVPYREAIGSLIYLSSGTRPDIAYAVNTAAQDVEHPTDISWRKVKRIFRYLKGTMDFNLVYKSGQKKELVGFSDADYATDKSRHSRTGMICTYAGCTLTWLSQKQKCISLSTMEAEYVAASEAAKQLVWLKRLLQDLTTGIGRPQLYVDNLSAVRLAKNPEFHFKSKHIDVRYHFVRKQVNLKELDVRHIDGERQLADILTKSLPNPRFGILARCVSDVTQMNFEGVSKES